MVFNSCEERRQRLKKAFVGTSLIPGAAYNVQVHMEMEGIHAIKVSPLRGNLCLLEELEAGYIEDFLGQKDNWWNSWFSEIKRWELGMVDELKEVWLRIYGIPALSWCGPPF